MYFENSLRGVRWLWLLPSFGTDHMYDFFLLNSHFVVDWSKLLLLAESNAGEKIAIRVFNHDYRATVNDVLRKLETAQLQRRGFTRTVINETVTTADERPVTSTVLHFYKKIPCRQLMYVEEEVRRLWPEAWGEDVSRRVVSAASRAMLFSGKMCTAGIEVHFPPRGGCAAKKEKRSSKRKCEDWCLFCFSANAEN